MTIDEFERWVKEIHVKVPDFLTKLKSSKTKGFYRYSLTSDLYGEDSKWGLGNVVFALKVYKTLKIDPLDLSEMVEYIKSFQQKDGFFFDPLVKRRSIMKRILNSIKNLNLNNFWYHQTKQAETRQAYSALKLFNQSTKYDYKDVLKSKEEIISFLEKLNWTRPWDAGSHFSHLLFFLSVSRLKEKNKLIDVAVDWINNLQKEDGAWYRSGNVTLQQKINGAMKVITGFKVASENGWNDKVIAFSKAKELIDLCLSASNNQQACDNFNIVYVLNYSDKVLNGSYRHDDISSFFCERLDVYKQYYFKDQGAFSFRLGHANRSYYGAIITKGKKEPDIHGTCMFLWGIAIIASFWDVDDKLELKEFTT